EKQHIVRHPDTVHCAIFADLLIQQTQSFSPLHLHYRVFPNRNAPVIDQARIGMRLNQIPREVLHPNRPVTPLSHRQVSAVNASNPTRLHYSRQSLSEELVLVDERLSCSSVT